MQPLWWEELDYPEGHSDHVAQLAEQLFELTKNLHRLDGSYKSLLSWAALLHDVGQSVSLRQHHKHSFHLVMEHGIAGLGKEDIGLVALIARYHRKADPSLSHPGFAALSKHQQDAVRKLASLLRLADGMDRSYGNVVQALSLSIHDHSAIFTLKGKGGMSEELAILPKKATLFEEVFELKTQFMVSSGH